ncbi:hypothetical protein PI95_020600 [Hassallia byssoidea VB512170]|uniref:Pentapeptide repeat-containing protein n=1 Tax=Hassallia byssoidea VB512170 TaxID=1304833 RepID=A0A846HD55_9CYAN|nr:pentapeptide repeat-containing protein [Hassalia byssoidea]NEU74888.1 hypothetical protein [Hassalia byssoidea VB512170]
MKPTVAIRRIDSFEKRFGKPHLYLAYHAAFPLALTPQLLYSLWANFQQDIHGELLNIPWESVADLLLSSLCQEVGHELYEIDSAVRNELLRRLKADKKFCDDDFHQDRILQLSDFLVEYVDRQLHSNDIDVRDFAEAQQWTALAYAKPGKAVEQIAQAFNKLQLDVLEVDSTQNTEILRLSSLIESFAETLEEAKLEPLLLYARGMASFSRGDLQEAIEQLSKISESGTIEIAGQEFPIPESLKENLGKPSLPPKQDFSGQNLRGKSFKNRDLTQANFSYADLRGANFVNAKLVGANFSYAKTGLQPRGAFGLMFCCFLLLFLSSATVSLLGAGWGESLNSLIRENYRNYNNTFISTSVVSLLIFAVSSIANIRKGWRLCLQTSLMITLLLAPAALLIGLLFNFPIKTLRLPDESDNAIAWAIVLIIIVIVFTFNCFWTVRKGVNTAWVAVALALMGIALPTLMLASVSSSSKNSLQSMPIEVSLLVVAIALGLGFAFTRFYENSRKNQLETNIRLHFWGKFRWIRFHLVLTAIIFAIALVAGKSHITIFLAFIAIALYLALALAFEAALPEITLVKMSVTLVVFVGIIVAIALGFSWIGLSSSTNQLTSLLISTLLIALIMAIFLMLAGVANLRSAIATIISIPVLFALLFTLGFINNFSTDSLPYFIYIAAFLITALAVTWATAVIIAVSIALTWAESGNQIIALFWSVSVVITSMLLIVGFLATSGASNLPIASSIVTSLATIQLSAYIGLQAISGNVKFTSVRNCALAFASAGGTNFAKSDLTNVEFTQATLKAANFRQAKINGTRWFGAKRLNRACGDSYLQYPLVQQLLVTNNGQNQKFDNLDLRGINLRGANLVDASFINTDLSEADLQGANLSRAKLLHTKLRKTNLAIAQLTGAYIYKCELTPETKLVGVECDYIYTQIPTKNNPDPGRKPELNGRIFKPGELAKVLISLYSTTTNRPENN